MAIGYVRLASNGDLVVEIADIGVSTPCPRVGEQVKSTTSQVYDVLNVLHKITDEEVVINVAPHTP